jgi:hypothetical protein
VGVIALRLCTRPVARSDSIQSYFYTRQLTSLDVASIPHVAMGGSVGFRDLARWAGATLLGGQTDGRPDVRSTAQACIRINLTHTRVARCKKHHNSSRHLFGSLHDIAHSSCLCWE